jgi:hypothetical protein
MAVQLGRPTLQVRFAQAMLVFFEPVSGRTERFTMEVDGDAPVSSIVADLAVRLDLPAELVRLVYYGTRLRANRSLHDQDVQKEGVIHVVEAKSGAAEPLDEITLVLNRSAGRTESITLPDDSTVRDLFIHVAKLWKVEPSRLRFTHSGGKRVPKEWERQLVKVGVKDKASLTVTMLLPDDPDVDPVPGFVLRHPSPVEPAAVVTATAAATGVGPAPAVHEKRIRVTEAGLVPQPKGKPIAHYELVMRQLDGSEKRVRARFSRFARVDAAIRAELPSETFPVFPHLNPFSRLWQCMGCGPWVAPVEDLRIQRARDLEEYVTRLVAASPRVETSTVFESIFHPAV